MNNFLQDIGELEKLKITVLSCDYSGYDNPFLGQHGVSFLIDAVSKNCSRRILLDAGQSEVPILYNMNILNIDPESIDTIVLSHCHFDHTGGLKGMLDNINKNIPIIAHSDIFRDNYMFKPYLKNIGMTGENTREKITASGGQPVLTSDSVRLMDGVITTGEVKRTTDFEKSFIGSYNLENGKMVPDEIKDDISIVTNVKDKGIFIITGCSHAGIINIIKHAQKITGIEKVYGIIGGLHLIESPKETELSKDRIEKTAKSFADMNLELVVAGHCTGIMALNEIKEAMGNKFVQLHSGQIINL